MATNAPGAIPNAVHGVLLAFPKGVALAIRGLIASHLTKVVYDHLRERRPWTRPPQD